MTILILKIVCNMDDSLEFKVINLLKRKGSLMIQEESAPFLLSVILEEFISDHTDDPDFSLELAFAERLDHFLLSDNLVYYDA